MKKRVIIVVSIIIAAIAIVGLYQTFALSNNITANGDMYTVTVGDGSVVSVPAGSSKTVYYKITNKNKGAVNYGVGYTGTGLTVKVFSDSDADAQDKINYGESKFIKLYVENKSTSSASTTLSTILGYENGGELIVPSGVSIVSEIYLGTLSRYITHLYNDADKTTVTNNSINYSYATANKIMKDNNDNLRYYGASPNNYVYFNCETYPSTNCEKWRIVGVFDGKTKLIRNESIGSYSWDTSSSTVNSGNGKNDWTQATLMKLLNPGYDDESAGASLYYNAEEGNCYNAANNGTGACNFTSNGIKNDSTRNIIADTTWPLGSGDAATYANLVYAKERGSNVFSGNSISWQGKVAVPYASDYGYAADFNNCTGELNAYNNSTCTANNWMKGIFNGAFAHLLTTYPDNGYVAWSVKDDGATAYYAYNTAQAEAVVPTLYLIAQTEVAGGEGTSANPYYLNVGNSDSSTYTVRYNANGGKNAPANQTKTKDVSLTLNSGVPSKNGYIFKGWATTSSATTATYQPGGSYTANKSITLYAVWSQNKVIVRFNTNSGTLASSTTYNGTTYTWTASGGTVSRKVGSGTATSDFFTINYGSQTGSDGLPDRSDTSTYLKITRSGYTTIADSAWICKSGCTTSGKVYDQSKVYSASDFCDASSSDCTVELNVNWKQTKTITYNANNGSGAPASQTIIEGMKVRISDTIPKRTNYTFKGWATTSSATTATFKAGEEYNYSDITSTTLYAVWEQATKYKVIVRFNTNGGTLTSPTTYGTTTYTWTAGSTGTISRKVGSGTATTDFFTITYGDNTSSTGLPANTSDSTYLKISKSGYTTLANSAWVCKSGCTTSGKVFASGTVYNASDFCNASSANCTVELNANWQKVHTITYNANGGSGAPASQSVINGSSFTASSTKPTRTGYTFLGWGSSSGATTVSYTPGTTYTPTSDLTLYAIWKINKVNFKFSTNGGTVQATSSNSGNTYKWKQDSNGIISRTDPNGSTYSEVFYTLDYGASTGSTGLPDYDNSAFLNITYSGYSAPENYEWKCLSGCSTNGKLFNQDPVYQASDFCDASNDDCTVVLGVNWKQVQTITYDANGGSGAPASQTKLDGSSITLSSTKPTRSGYTFVNWNTKADGSGTSYNAGTAYTAIGTTTLYAQWEASVYTVTLNTQSATSNGTTKVYYQYNTTKTINGTVCYYYTDSSLTSCLSSGYVLTKPTKTGYTFNGYYTSTSGGGTQYVDKDGRFIHNLYTTIGNKTLYAYWSPAVYTITLNNQSATTAGTTKVYYQYNTTKTINGTVCYYYTNSALTSCLSSGYNITKPTKTAYVFGGYYTGTNGSGTNYVNSSGTFINNAYQTTGNKTLYAKWTKNTTKPGLDYDPSGAYRVCSGTRLTLTCTDKSGSGKINAWMHDNDTISTGTGTTTANARDNLNTLRSGGITTEFKCTDGNGNVSTASTKYTVVSCTSSGGSGGGAISTGKCSCSIAKDCVGTGRYDTKCVNGACYWANESGGALRGCY